MTMIIIPVRSTPPTHETVERCYTDEAGRSITLSVYARIGNTDKPFALVPPSWKRDYRAEEAMGPFAYWGLSLLALLFLGFALFFGTLLLSVAGWLPLSGIGGDTIDSLDAVFPWFVRGALIFAIAGFIIACGAQLIRFALKQERR